MFISSFFFTALRKNSKKKKNPSVFIPNFAHIAKLFDDTVS